MLRALALLLVLAFGTLLLALPSAALPIPHREHREHREHRAEHHRRELPLAAPAPASRHEVPVPQGGSFHNETHWWVPDTVHHGRVEDERQAGDNTDIGGRRVQMHVVAGRARTSWA